jgi:crotonobetainyl-CoA:carnitine CoA-transferase CaiB-like acyl-CoA transferase
VGSRPSGEVIATMDAARVPAGRILSTADIAADEQYRQRGMIQAAAPPSGGRREARGRGAVQSRGRAVARGACSFKAPSPPAHAAPLPLSSSPQPGGPPLTLPAMLPVMAGTPGGTRWAGPDLGEHTEEVLRGELGLGDADIQRLRDCGAI